MERKIPGMKRGVFRSLSSREAYMESGQGKSENITIKDSPQHLEKLFTDYRLFTRALTHRSFLNEHPDALEDNERLEFLGDAVLNFLVAAWLYNRFPEMAEGSLTRLRASLVGNDRLAEFAQQIGLGEIMRLGRGEDESGGRKRLALLGSTFEAVIGALYLDQGISAVSRFIGPLLENAIDVILNGGMDHDPKSLLQEWAQAEGLGTPYYQTVDTYGPEHEKIFEVEVIIQGKVSGRGRGSSKQSAAKVAALDALSTQGVEF